jgi:5-methylcytosine-specific restriction protein B
LIKKGNANNPFLSQSIYREVSKVMLKKDTLRERFESYQNVYDFKESINILTQDFIYFCSKNFSDKNIQTEKLDNGDQKNYYFLCANPKIWSLNDIGVGEEVQYTKLNENGNKRRVFQNFCTIKKGDVVIGYEGSPTKQIIAILEATSNEEEYITLKKSEILLNPIGYADFSGLNELSKFQFIKAPQGSLFVLEKEAYETLMNLIRENNPLSENNKTISPYDKEQFLKEVFMKESDYDSLLKLLTTKKNVILQGPPGVGKTFVSKRLAYTMLGNKNRDRIEFVQFHQNYYYEDFVLGYKPNENGFALQEGIFYKFCKKASNFPDEDFFFIIDEINRGNLSKIFGELLMLIENDYRGEQITLAYGQITFQVPKNVYIIGMMNTADRSLAMIDYALRRRFSFYEMNPGYLTGGFKKYQDKLDSKVFNRIIDTVISLNKEITDDESLGEGFCIGHSYFSDIDNTDNLELLNIIKYDIIPTLKEYWYDNLDKYLKWKNELLREFDEK